MVQGYYYNIVYLPSHTGTISTTLYMWVSNIIVDYFWNKVGGGIILRYK